MKKNAIIFTSQQVGCDTEMLEKFCSERDFEVVRREFPDEHTELDVPLTENPGLIFIPSVSSDCLAVKAVQDIIAAAEMSGRTEKEKQYQGANTSVILVYGPKLDDADFICLAFRQGADDIIDISAGRQAVEMQINRAERLLKHRRENVLTDSTALQKITELEKQCAKLERINARFEERLLALASAGTRMATGNLSIAADAPPLLIATPSQSQGQTASELASQLGFSPHVFTAGKEALENIERIQPRVILTSSTLADTDASGFARQARKLLGSSPVIVIVWSSNLDKEDEYLEPESGFDDFVPKTADSESTGRLAAALIGGLR